MTGLADVDRLKLFILEVFKFTSYRVCAFSVACVALCQCACFAVSVRVDVLPICISRIFHIVYKIPLIRQIS